MTYPAAGGAGLAMALGQAPWGLWPLTLVGLAVFLSICAGARDTRGAFWRGWVAGAAQFALALCWIVEPFLIEPDRHAWMAPFALVFLAGGLALFWGAAGALGHWLARKPAPRLFTLALSLAAFEALRGHLFTGFPWAMLGHVWIDTPVGQVAAMSGAPGLSALTLALSAALALAARRILRRQVLRGVALATGAAVVLAGVWMAGAARLDRPAAAPHDITLRLVQPNAPQDLKWHPAHAEAFFLRHLELTAHDGGPVDLVLWSETAVPFYLETPGDGLTMAAQAAAGAPILMGIQRREWHQAGPRWFNSLALIDAAGEPQAIYDKHHLVPFGEYVPLVGEWAARRGLRALAQVSLLGYTPGPGPALIDLGAAGRVLPLICYEAVFPRNLRGTARPDWIYQATNDAWFGAWIGPFQHLDQARLRAIETGLPLVRVANTGVSAVIDARGRVLHELGMDVAGTIDAPLPGAEPPTIWARLGDLPAHVIMTVALIALIWRRRRLAH